MAGSLLRAAVEKFSALAPGLAYVAVARAQIHFNFGLMPRNAAGGEICRPDGATWEPATPPASMRR